MPLNKANFTSTGEPLHENQYLDTTTSSIPTAQSTLALKGQPSQLVLDPPVSRSDLSGVVNNAPLGRSMFTNPNVQQLNNSLENKRVPDSLISLQQILNDQHNSNSTNPISVNTDVSIDLAGLNDLSLEE